MNTITIRLLEGIRHLTDCDFETSKNSMKETPVFHPSALASGCVCQLSRKNHEISHQLQKSE